MSLAEKAAKMLQDIRILERCYDGWRVVNPCARHVIYNSPQSVALGSNDQCYAFWEKGEACVNCIAMRAYVEKQTFLKIEYTGGQLFMINAVPAELEGQAVVIELIKDVTGRSIFENLFGQATDITQLACTINNLNEAAVKDELTQVFNRRYIGERLPPDLVAAHISGQQLAVVLVDIDHFKNINDTYGHQAGDEVLKAFASLLACSVRKTDWVARYGGEEFFITLAGAGGGNLAAVAEGLRRRVENARITTAAGEIAVTASFGAYVVKDLRTETLEDIIAQADKNLYQAKADGRNRAVCS
jgi:two-component system cell cycle response regulator